MSQRHRSIANSLVLFLLVAFIPTAFDMPRISRIHAVGERHLLAASYYNLSDGFSSTLMLSNQGPNTMPVQVRLFSPDGRQFDLPTVNLSGDEVRLLDLAGYITRGTGFEQGSLQVQYQGRKLELGGVVTHTKEAQSIIFDEELVNPAGEFA